MVRQASWRRSCSRHAAVRDCASRESVGFKAREPMSMNTIVQSSSNGPTPVRGRVCEARVLGPLMSIHGATHGGPRGSVPGRNDSMRTI